MRMFGKPLKLHEELSSAISRDPKQTYARQAQKHLRLVQSKECKDWKDYGCSSQHASRINMKSPDLLLQCLSDRQEGAKVFFCEVAAFYYMLKYDQRCSFLATSLADTAANSEMCCFFLLEVFIIDYYVVRISYTYTILNSLCFVIFSLVGCMNPKHPAKPVLLLYNRYSFLINLQVIPGCISNSLSPV